MDLSETPVVGTIAGGVGAGFDLILNGGEILATLGIWLISTPDAWISILFYLDNLAGMLTWIPEGPVESLLIAGLMLMIGVTVADLVSRWRDS